MRRLFALCLAVCLVLSVVGCSGSKDDSSSDLLPQYFDGENTVDISAEKILSDARQGHFPASDSAGETVVVSLGNTKEELMTALDNSDVSETTGTVYTKLSTGRTDFYLSNENTDAGIIATLHFGMAFGLEVGLTNKEQLVAVMGEADSESTLTADQKWMLPDQSSDTTRMIYYCDNNRLDFYFTNDVLSVICLCNNEQWQE